MERKLKNMKGITLIALVITIIILIILAGVSLNILLGSDGLIEKAKRGADAYTEESVREKVELELANLTISNLNTNNSLTIEEVLEKFLENGTFETIDAETNSGVINNCEVILKYSENGSIVIEEITEANGIRASYVLTPDTYTKDDVTIKFKATGKLKNVTKPDGTVVEATSELVEIEYPVTANGTYIFKVEDENENVKEKEVVVDIIDTLAPKDFTLSSTSTLTELKIITNAKDADATETSASSGIDRCEYYVKLTTEQNYTKYDTNTIELAVGSYNVYVIAYDKAGNPKQSAVTTLTKIQGPASDYGQGEKVNYTANGISDWKIFYKNKETDEVFIIASNYLTSANQPSEISMSNYYIRWKNPPAYIEITEDTRNRFMMSWNKNTTGKGIKITSVLLDPNIWDVFATKENSYAIGSPTLEMFAASWNDYYPNNPIACNTSNNNGYYYKLGLDSGTNDDRVSLPSAYKTNKLYFQSYGDTMEYWLASPAAYSNSFVIQIEDYYSKYCVGQGDPAEAVSGLRPVVCLPASLLEYDSATATWNVK